MHLLRCVASLAFAACNSPAASQGAVDITGTLGSSSAGSGSAAVDSSSEATSSSDGVDCDFDKNAVDAIFGLDAPDDSFVMGRSGAELAVSSDMCAVTAVESTGIDFECTYAEPPTLRQYSLTLDLRPQPSSMPFVLGMQFEMSAHILSVFEAASFSWIRFEQNAAPLFIGWKLGEVWSDDSLPTIAEEAFGGLARETETELCRTSVANGTGTRSEETMEFKSGSGWLEVRHDEEIVLDGAAGLAVWLGEALFRQEVGDSGKYRSRQVVVLRDAGRY